MATRKKTTTRTKRKARTPKNINVQVAVIGESLKVYEVPAKSTVSDVLSKANISHNGRDVRVDAAPAKLTDRIKANQIITVVGRIQGGVR